MKFDPSMFKDIFGKADDMIMKAYENGWFIWIILGIIVVFLLLLFK